MFDRSGVPASTQGNPVSSVRLASFGVVAGGALWGLFWIPVRMFEELGLTGAWPGFVIYAAALLIISPFAFAKKLPPVSIWQLASAGLLTGAAVTFYGTAIILTDVLRAILFFYLTPVWGTVMGVAFLGERLTIARVVAIILALCGLVAVVGFGSHAAVNTGDILALASGLFWAIGTYKIYRISDTPAIHLSAAFLGGGILVSIALLAVGGDVLGPWPEFPPLKTLAPYVLLSGLFAVPMILLTIWPASVLTPGRIGILLMSEVVVGVASVAVLAAEPFGPYEVLGTILILAASVIEVTGNRS